MTRVREPFTPTPNGVSNHHAILRKFDQSWFLMPKGTTALIRQLVQPAHALPAADPGRLREQLLRHLLSSSWKVTGPVRLLGRLLGARKIRFDFNENDPGALRSRIRMVRDSVSWRPLRWRKAYWWDRDP